MAQTYSVKAEADVPIELRDGVTTYANVYRPDAPGPFPTLLSRTPYDKSGPASASGSMDAFRAARSGYAVVIQDVRGRYSSEGEFDPFFNEINDGYDSVEWALPPSRGAAAKWGCGATPTSGPHSGWLRYPVHRRWRPSSPA